MITFHSKIDGEPVTVKAVETPADLEEFSRWMGEQNLVACDTETTGLDIFSPNFKCHTVQFGNASMAYVLQNCPEARPYIQSALKHVPFLVFHNSTFDWLVLDRHVGVPMEDIMGKSFDTMICSHLIDPRSESEGGMGHGLKRLSEIWVDPDAPDSQRALQDRFRELKATKDTGWAVISPTDPVLLEYAGVDTILTFRLFMVLRDIVKDAGLSHLDSFERHLQAILATVQRRGMLLDVEYTEDLKVRLEAEAIQFEAVAARYGVKSLNATAQVAEALTAMGETLTEKTDSGKPKVDKDVLMPLADLDRNWERIGAREPNPLADAVLRGKRAGKWATTYAQAFLELKDSDNRLHASIHGLQARTARMSISRPPLQQLPASDHTVRRCFVAEPGHKLVSIDYSQIEIRVMAALSEDVALTEAILSGVDLHSNTAQRIYGDDYTKQQRAICKTILFGTSYGGGASTIQRQTGAPLSEVKSALSRFHRTYPGLKRYSNKLQRRAESGKREVVTPVGRHLPLDRDRTYAAMNAMVQSTARDVLAQAIVDIHAAGLSQFIILPIHDELLLSIPEAEVDSIVARFVEIMTVDFMGIPLTVDAEILGDSWGDGYA